MCGSHLEFFSGGLIKLNTTIGASEQRKWLNPEGISSDGSFLYYQVRFYFQLYISKFFLSVGKMFFL